MTKLFVNKVITGMVLLVLNMELAKVDITIWMVSVFLMVTLSDLKIYLQSLKIVELREILII
jgi:hypothetical protein